MHAQKMTAWVSWGSQLTDFKEPNICVLWGGWEQAAGMCPGFPSLPVPVGPSTGALPFATRFWLSRELADHRYLPQTPRAQTSTEVPQYKTGARPGWRLFTAPLLWGGFAGCGHCLKTGSPVRKAKWSWVVPLGSCKTQGSDVRAVRSFIIC